MVNRLPPALSLQVRRRWAVRVGLASILIALLVASFGGLGIRSLHSDDPNELVICTPAGVKVVNLQTGQFVPPPDNSQAQERPCVLSLPLAGVTALVLLFCLLCILPLRQRQSTPFEQSTHDRPHLWLLGFDHRPRAPPMTVVFA